MNRYLVGSTYGRFCIKFPQSRMKGERHRLSGTQAQSSEPLVLVPCHMLPVEPWEIIICKSISLPVYRNYQKGQSRYNFIIIPSPMNLRRVIVMLPSVRPSFRNILVNTLESTSFNGF